MRQIAVCKCQSAIKFLSESLQLLLSGCEIRKIKNLIWYKIKEIKLVKKINNLNKYKKFKSVKIN